MRVDQIIFGVGVALVQGQLLGEAQGPAPGDDGDLVDGVGARGEPGHQGMAGLVVGGVAAFPLGQDEALAFGAHEDLVFGLLKVVHGDQIAAPAGRKQGGFVGQVLQVGSGKSGGAPGQDGEVHGVGQGGAAGMDLEDGFPAFEVRDRDHHLAVEATGTQQGRVQDVGTVGGGDEDHPFVGLKAVHFHQELVQGLFPLIVAAAQTGAPMAAHGVDFIDEDDAGGAFLALDEQVPHPGGAHADEHLHEVGAADAEEGDPGFAGDGPGQQGLAGARGAHQEHALGDAAAQAGELLGVFEEIDDFRHLFLGFLDAGHIIEGDLDGGFRHEAGPALAEGHGLAAAGLHLAHKEDPDAHQDQHGQPGDQEGGVPGGIILGLGGDLHLLGLEELHQVRVGGGVALEGLAVCPVRR